MKSLSKWWSLIVERFWVENIFESLISKRFYEHNSIMLIFNEYKKKSALNANSSKCGDVCLWKWNIFVDFW